MPYLQYMYLKWLAGQYHLYNKVNVTTTTPHIHVGNPINLIKGSIIIMLYIIIMYIIVMYIIFYYVKRNWEISSIPESALLYLQLTLTFV